MGLMGAAVGLLGAGTIMQAVGSAKAGRDQQRAYEYNAQVMENNARQSEYVAKQNQKFYEDEAANAMTIQRYNADMYGREATAAVAKAQFDAKLQSTKDMQTRARNMVKMSSSGVDVGMGSPLLVDAMDAYYSDMSERNILHTGYVSAATMQNKGNLALYMGGIESNKNKNLGLQQIQEGNIKALNYTSAAGLAKLSGSQARSAGDIGAATALLTGGAGVAYGASKI